MRLAKVDASILILSDLLSLFRKIFTAFRYVPFGLLKRSVSHDETARFRTPKGMYLNVVDNETVTRMALFVCWSEKFLHTTPLYCVMLPHTADSLEEAESLLTPD